MNICVFRNHHGTIGTMAGTTPSNGEMRIRIVFCLIHLLLIIILLKRVCTNLELPFFRILRRALAPPEERASERASERGSERASERASPPVSTFMARRFLSFRSCRSSGAQLNKPDSNESLRPQKNLLSNVNRNAVGTNPVLHDESESP